MQSMASDATDGEKNLPVQKVEKVKRLKLLKRSFAVLGPGLITGAADDDPSGIPPVSTR
jgi:hypothetical protein